MDWTILDLELDTIKPDVQKSDDDDDDDYDHDLKDKYVVINKKKMR